MTELKPCPMCGFTDLDGFVLLEVEGYVECLRCGATAITLEEWNNAWAHKRIEELEAKVETLTEVADYFEMQLIEARLGRRK